MIFPISQWQLAALKVHYKLYEHQGRACFQCRKCAVVFLLTPANLTPGNYEGFLSHATLCVSGLEPGPFPARTKPFGTRVHER